MSFQDASLLREVMRDINRRPIDITDLDIHVSNGSVYLRGRIDFIKGNSEPVDLKQELNVIIKMLYSRQGVRSVIDEVEIPQAPVQKKKDDDEGWNTYY